jgi:hypothetical protein
VRGWTTCVAVAVAWALCSSALADEPAQAWQQAGAVGDERLAALRAGVAAPATLQQAGVILWDEPRKAPPPPRNASTDNGGSALLTASVTHR